MTITREQRRRAEWLRVVFADVAGAGKPIDEHDLQQLPVKHHAELKAIAANARSLHRAGQQADALNLARAAVRELDTQIDPDWFPKRERPDATIVDEIRGGPYVR
jgi:hypothetical protein